MENTIQIAAADHPIKSVTIFKSAKGEIVRTFDLDLKAGQNKIEISGLSSSINTDSVRVSGLGDARLFDVVCSLSPQRSETTQDATNSLKERKVSLQNAKAIHQQEAELLYSYAKTLTGEHVKPEQMTAFLAGYGEQSRKCGAAVEAIDREINDIDTEIAKVKDKSATKVGSSRGTVTVVIGTDIDDTIELKLTYIVSNVSWTPAYELHAQTVKGKPSNTVSLQYRAKVKQSTGEDWTNTSLTLSTVSSDTSAKSIPELAPVKIRPQTVGYGGPARPQMQQMQMMQQQQMMQPQQMAMQSRAAAPPPPAARRSAAVRTSSSSVGGEEAADDDSFSVFEDLSLPSLTEPTTVVTETPMAISYSVHGKSTIPSDEKDHQVSIAVLPFEAQISYVTIPRIEPCVYLQCEVKNTSEYRLLPGPVTVILDDSYVSKTSVNDVNTGDTFSCTLGDDTSTKVTYSRTSKTVKSGGGSFVEAVNTTTYTTRITIHNKHQFPIEHLLVRDVIPTSDDKRVKVILRRPEGLAGAKDGELVDVGASGTSNAGLKVGWEKLTDGKGGEKEGKFEWKWNVDSGAKVKLEAEWEVKAPADITTTEVVSYPVKGRNNPWS
ncbi:hypothetical protein BDN72DRAFT_965157 [Pluteus cervinus]|uniref:Uncharacterized protein n=1 Tax=Pluteus cervinus TaxID=181527 RepID=A0ACD3A7S7_9AGAR|nr:hypothetical protein BDN72DRAFT_965157 [Pluteus cervinus]